VRPHRNIRICLLSALFISAIMLSACPHMGHSGPQASHYNLLIIVLDAVRADHLSCYGYPRKTSPNIDSLSSEGTLFKHAYSQSSCTVPAVHSMLTSLYPSRHRIFLFDEDLPPDTTTLFSVLKERGFATAVISESPFVERRFAFTGGVDYIFTSGLLLNKNTRWARESLRMFYEVRDSIKVFLHKYVISKDKRSVLYFRKFYAKQVLRESVSWLRRNRDNPFCLYVHFMGGHYPYNPPSPYGDLFFEEGMTKVPKYEEREESAGTISGPRLKGAISQYDGLIAFYDELTGSLVRELKDMGLYENTVIVITADHGEAFFEHGRSTHGHYMYEEIVHIPLMMIFPSRQGKGTAFDGLVQHIDLMPTVLDALGAEMPEEIDGKSFLGVLESGGDVMDRIAYSELQDREGGKFFAVREEDHKLVVNDLPGHRSVELYNIAEDPAERHDIADAEPSETARMSKILEDYRAAGRGAGKEANTRKIKLTPAFIEDLKSLGYMQ